MIYLIMCMFQIGARVGIDLDANLENVADKDLGKEGIVIEVFPVEYKAINTAIGMVKKSITNQVSGINNYRIKKNIHPCMVTGELLHQKHF